MAENDEERSPLIALKDLRVEDKVKLKLDCAKAVKTGETTYGMWHLWFANVENARVRYGRGASQKIVDGYNGKAIFFPSERLNTDLEKAADGNVDVDIEITKKEERGNGKTITKYIVSKLSQGKAMENASSYTPTEAKLVADSKELKDDGYKITEELFLKAALEPQYSGKISESRARELYKQL